MRFFLYIFLAILFLGGCSNYDDGYSQGHDDGKQEGYSSGYSAGKRDGYSDGYTAGETAGYDKGYEKGYETGKDEGYGNGYKDGTVMFIKENGLPSLGMTILTLLLSAFLYGLYALFKGPVKTIIDNTAGNAEGALLVFLKNNGWPFLQNTASQLPLQPDSSPQNGLRTQPDAMATNNNIAKQ